MAIKELTAYVHRTWKQEYRGVWVHVCHWGAPEKPEFYSEEDSPVLAGRPKGMCDGHGMWNYYLTLPEEIFEGDDFERFWLPAEIDDKGRAHHNYYVSPLTDLEWHGGITFYEKRQDVDSERRWVKLGCDYGHLWDSEAGYPYDKNYVFYDACRSVDRLHELFPNLRRRCAWNGRYYPQDQGSEVQPGVWQSFEGQQDKAEWRANTD